jgi:hypothetical protein
MHNFNNLDLPNVTIGQNQLHYCCSVKNLGIMFNSCLNWIDHVNITCNKVFAGIHSLKRVRECLPLNMRLMLVKSLIFPHFSYCDAVYNDLTVELSLKLQRAQNYCLRFVYNLRWDDHISSYYHSASILNLENRRKFNILKLLHKTLYNKSPVYLLNRFSFSSQISNRSTRNSSSMLVIPRHRTVMFNKSFTVSAARYWNSLPDEIKIIEGSARFGRLLFDWLLRNSILEAGIGRL